MSLKRPRFHYSGYTNLDFRTKGNEDALKVYQPWRVPQNFGMMGQANYKPISLKTYRFQNNYQRNSNIPDPKIQEGINFYLKNNISPNVKVDFPTTRAAQLEEQILGKPVFVGDSLMIQDMYKKRNEAKKEKSAKKTERPRFKGGYLTLRRNQSQPIISKKFKDNSVLEEKEKKEKEEKEELEKIAKKTNDIKRINETARVENKHRKFIEEDKEIMSINSKIPNERLLEIRQKLRDRYSFRGKLMLIYTGWNDNSKKEISVDQTYKKINDLGIKCSREEAIELIKSVNMRGTDSMNLSEFCSLIYGKGKNKIFRTTSALLRNNLRNNMDYLDEFLRRTITNMYRANYKSEDQNRLTYEKFFELMHKHNLPEQFRKDDKILRNFFDKYLELTNKSKYANKESEKNPEIDLRVIRNEFIERAMNLNPEEDFYGINDRLSEYSQRHIQRSKSAIMNMVNDDKYKFFRNKYYDQYTQIIKDEMKIKKQKEIDEKYKIYYPGEMDVNSAQPSTEFINKMFRNYKEHIDFQEKETDKIRPKMNLSLKSSTRTGLNPYNNDSFKWAQYEINEGERLKTGRMDYSTELIKKDKENAYRIKMARASLVGIRNRNLQEYLSFLDNQREMMEINKLNNKRQLDLEFNAVNRDKNQLLE